MALQSQLPVPTGMPLSPPATTTTMTTTNHNNNNINHNNDNNNNDAIPIVDEQILDPNVEVCVL
jgi:hypothetical protein